MCERVSQRTTAAASTPMPVSELDQVHGVGTRLRDHRQQRLPGAEQEDEAAGGRDGEDAEREGRHVSPRVAPDRKEERRAKSRGVDRVDRGDRDDEDDQHEHPASLSEL